MQDFRNLKVWEKAHNLTLLVYQLTMNFPREELFGLRTQLRKTCVEFPHISLKVAERRMMPNLPVVGTSL